VLKRGVLWSLVAVVSLTLVVSLAVWDYFHYLDAPLAAEEEQQGRVEKIVIAEGTSLSAVLTSLEEHGVVTSPIWFRLYLLWTEKAGKIRAGVYHFSFDMSPRQIADLLVAGAKNPFLRLLVREGDNVWQIAQSMEAAGIAPADQVLGLARDPEFARKLGVPVPIASGVLFHLEGYLFPETYYIEPGQPLEKILGRMVKQTLIELDAAKRRFLKEHAEVHREFALTDRELLILASLAERETALAHEKRLIVGVFLNRIREGMKLQTDPTLTYTEEKKGGKSTPEDIKNLDNSYNTYAHEGLPPGPICNPGRAALDGAVAPVRSEFLFFVAKRDGTGGHEFNRTYEEHKRAIKKYLQK